MNRIAQAQTFLNETVFDPALASTTFPKDGKNTIRNSKKWVQEFKKVGDLARYLGRFWESQGSGEPSPIVQHLSADGLNTFEDIEPEFRKKFGDEFDDCTTIGDFVIGQSYSSWDLAIFSQTYDNRQGILLIGRGDPRVAIFVKATMNEGRYPNEWLEPGKVLKYYLKARKDRSTGNQIFKETDKQNAAIIASGETPIFVFEKDNNKKNRRPLTLVGALRFAGLGEDEDGAKWFRLERRDLFDQPNRFTVEQQSTELEERVGASRASTSDERKKRLAGAKKKPKVRIAFAISYDRNPDVIAEVLERAAGVCEWCQQPAPFMRNKDQTPFLEVHHVVPLSKDGDDSVDNAVALCPNCHRKSHFGTQPNPYFQQ